MADSTGTRVGPPLVKPPRKRHDRLIMGVIIAAIGVCLVFLGLLSYAFWAQAHAHYAKVRAVTATHTATRTQVIYRTRYRNVIVPHFIVTTHYVPGPAVTVTEHGHSQPQPAVTVTVTASPVPAGTPQG